MKSRNAQPRSRAASGPAHRARKPRIRIVVAESRALDRRGLMALLAGESDFEVAGQAANTAEAVERCASLRPAVLLLALDLPDASGGSALPTIRAALPGLTRRLDPDAVPDLLWRLEGTGGWSSNPRMGSPSDAAGVATWRTDLSQTTSMSAGDLERLLPGQPLRQPGRQGQASVHPAAGRARVMWCGRQIRSPGDTADRLPDRPYRLLPQHPRARLRSSQPNDPQPSGHRAAGGCVHCPAG